MKRALTLIITLTLLTFGCGWWLDSLQRSTALNYLERLQTLRDGIRAEEMDDALRRLTALHSQWQEDAHWLNLLSDHHNTRDVDGILQRLTTALEENNRLTALLILDEAIDTLEEVAQKDHYPLENIL